MKAGYLSEFFSGVALKTLSAVEADPARSNQREFNGVEDLMRLFGETRGLPLRDFSVEEFFDRSVTTCRVPNGCISAFKVARWLTLSSILEGMMTL